MKSSVMTSPSGAWRAWLNEETLQPRDRQMMGMLLPLGIEKGKEFKPDAATVAQLKAAAAEALAWLMDKAATDVTPWWPNRQWCLPTPPITVPTDFKWETPNYFGVDARGIALSQYFCPTAKLGTGSFYFATFHDHSGKPLEGQKTYRLHVPANVPVRDFCSATVYSLRTSSFFLNAERLTLGSLDKDLARTPTAPWTSTLDQSRLPVRRQIGSTPNRARNGFRGSECMAQRRRSSTRAGYFRSFRLGLILAAACRANVLLQSSEII